MPYNTLKSAYEIKPKEHMYTGSIGSHLCMYKLCTYIRIVHHNLTTVFGLLGLYTVPFCPASSSKPTAHPHPHFYIC